MNGEPELRATLMHIAALCDMGLMDPGVDVAGHALREKLGQVRAVALAALGLPPPNPVEMVSDLLGRALGTDWRNVE